MCQQHNSRFIYPSRVKVDACLPNLLETLDANGMKILGSCCGHGRYPMSIVYMSSNGHIWELCSGAALYRTKRFYLKDKEGYYYIPEAIERFKNKKR